MATETVQAGPRESTGRRIIKNLRWWILGWALLAGIVNYMDRSAIAIAAPEMIKQLALTKTDIGLLGTVFSWVYAFSQLPAGWLIDKLGARRMYFLAIGLWSVSTALMAIGTTMWQFITFRALLGITEAPNSPASAKVTAEWFPRAERAQATAVWDSGSKWGPAIAPPILTAILLAFGWQAIFVFLGVLGVLLAIGFFVFYRSPEEHRRLGQQEFEMIQRDRAGTSVSGVNTSWGGLFKHRQVWGLMAGFFCVIWIWNLFIVFLPLYLQQARGVSIANTGFLAAVPYLVAAVMGITGGYIITRYSRRPGTSPLAAKRHVMVIASIASGVLVCLVPFIADLTLSMVVLSVAMGCIATMTSAAWAMPGDIVDTKQVASVGAIMNFGGYFGGAFSPLIAGMIADATGSYTPSFVLGGVIAALAAVAYVALVRRPIGAGRTEEVIGA
ncbi:MFS transporter [Paenarthrobacter sp. DKR-5]|uniref:MFS transporter n=1 Tax=Paenarthrobacter sp. DKR-5 TaxID=2835535 RepID=UPI001BDBD378|nr:MFS transporter [Paenarthrobacter sp. DKR-5]MBT1004141.1 MFS transporter [Paenarthrobacter sp. DKR-5]